VPKYLGLAERQWVELERRIAQVINSMSLESACGDVPDFVIAQYLTDCLANYIRVHEKLINWRQ
jgi:hypothetical protein